MAFYSVVDLQYKEIFPTHCKLTMIKHVELIRPINSGKYGTVYKAYDHRVKQFRAVKMLPLRRHDVESKQNMRMIENEIGNMLRLNGHPNIVKLHDILRDDDNVYIVQELCGGNTLQELHIEGSLSHEARIKAIRNMTSAICACHEAKIIFGDLKPTNIIEATQKGSFKLTDFGASIYALSHHSITMATPMFAAPELFFEGYASYSFDVWSIGILAYMLMFNEHPFQEPNSGSFNINAFKNTLCFPSSTPTLAQDFISQALSLDPEKRPTSQQLLMHSFLYPRSNGDQ